MGELTKLKDIPTPTPRVSDGMSKQELTEHRGRIAFEVKTVLSAYFQPHEAEEIKAAQLAWWCDELQDWTQEQVLWGLRQWNRDNPRLRPTPGNIVAVCKEARGKKYAASLPPATPPQEPPRVSREAAAEIMARHFGADSPINRMEASNAQD